MGCYEASPIKTVVVTLPVTYDEQWQHKTRLPCGAVRSQVLPHLSQEKHQEIIPVSWGGEQ